MGSARASPWPPAPLRTTLKPAALEPAGRAGFGTCKSCVLRFCTGKSSCHTFSGAWGSCPRCSACRCVHAARRLAYAVGDHFGWLRAQKWIEHAWAQGFDRQGASQFGGVLHGTTKWIGATEVAAVLRSCRVPARVIDFHAAEDPFIQTLVQHHTMFQFYDPVHHTIVRGLPRSVLHVEASAAGPSSAARSHAARHAGLVNFAWHHFSGAASPAEASTQVTGAHAGAPLPLYLQHDGHSRTIIGIERRDRAKSEQSKVQGLKGGVRQARLDTMLQTEQAPAPCLAAAAGPPSPLVQEGGADTTVVDLTGDSTSEDEDISPVQGTFTVGSAGTGQPDMASAAPLDFGCEEAFLVMFDPAKPTAAYTKALQPAEGELFPVGWEKHFKRGLHTLRHPQYQVVHVPEGVAPLTDEELPAWREVHGVKVLPIETLIAAAHSVYGS